MEQVLGRGIASQKSCRMGGRLGSVGTARYCKLWAAGTARTGHHDLLCCFASAGSHDLGHPGCIPRRGLCGHIRYVRPAGASHLRAAALPWPWLYMGTGLLGLGPGLRLLLGARRVGASAVSGCAMDSRLLGLER